MKKTLFAVIAAILTACGPGSSQTSDAPAYLGSVVTQNVVAQVRQTLPGERKAYDITWNSGQMVGIAKLPELANFQTTATEVRLPDISLSFDKDGGTGQLYRLYQAAFGRVPDVAGFGYWKNAIDSRGETISQVATDFLASAESKTVFGLDIDDATFVQRVYQHVLNRTPDVAGADYWTNVLKSGASRVSVLLAFTDSAENKAATDASISKGMAFAEPSVAYIPVASATGPTDVAVGISVEVDGSKSSDANGDELHFNWSVTAHPIGSTTAFENSTVAKPHIVFDKPGSYELTLSVSDATSHSYTSAKLTILAHALITDTGSYICSALTPAQAVSLYANGHTYLDRNKNGIPCDASDIAFEHAPTVTPIADSGKYKCSEISHDTAVLLFLQGHTYLDRDHDGKPCEATDISIEHILYPPVPVTTPSTGQCWVNGYTRKDGTHVSGYWRRC